jgi:hypothetical protein
MTSETSLISSIRCINWRFIIILAAFLMTIHFILFNNDFIPLKKERHESQSPSHSHSGNKNFFDLHDLKAVPEVIPETPSKESAPSTTEETSLKDSSSAIASTSTDSELLPTTSTFLTEALSANVVEASESQNRQELRPTGTTDSSGATGLTTSLTVATASAATGNAKKEYVAICLAVKDQSRDLAEWLTHHYHHVGIKRFYIMDDGSDPPLSSFDMDYGVPESAVTFHYQDRATRGVRMQAIFYSQCIEWHGTNHTWMAYIDVDEFLEATSKKETLDDILKSFEPDDLVGALGVNWKTHTSNGLLKRPESCRKAFTTCLVDSPAELYGGTDDNHHIKSIVKTSFFGGCQNPHKFGLRDGAMTVGETGDIIHGLAWRSPITRDRIALHHYAVKSREEFEEKMLRSNGMSDPKSEGFWDHVENQIPQEECREMAQYDL